MLSINQIKSIVKSSVGSELLIKEKSRDSRLYIFLEGKEKTLFSYVKTDNNNPDLIVSGYFVLQKWWLEKLPAYRQDFYYNLSSVKRKDGIKIEDFKIEFLNELLSTIDWKADTSSLSSPSSTLVKTKKEKRKGLTAQQSQTIKELNEYTCDCCGVNLNLAIKQFPFKGYESVKNKLIQVHHKIRKMHNKPRDHISNLTTLCTICHGEQEGKGHHFQRSEKTHHIILKEIRESQNIFLQQET